MLVTLFDPDTLLHETVELLGSKLIPALESPERVKAILKALHSSPYEVRSKQTTDISDDILSSQILKLATQTHDNGYLDHLQTVYTDWLSAGLIGPNESVLPECFRLISSVEKPIRPPKDLFARAGYYAFDMSTGIMAQSYRAMVASAYLASWGAEILLSAPYVATPLYPTSVFALCRPPGHHCDGKQAGGYCYINNAAVAVSMWRSKHPEAKVGILDLDFHHGNGTQEIFYRDPNVLYVSIHGEDEFPYYTGAEDETGLGDAQGMNVNLPLKPGSLVGEYLGKLKYGLEKLTDYGPEFLIVSLGFDTFHLDPLGSFQIDTDDYETIARTTRQTLSGIPALILLEGGYVIEHLGNNVLSFLRGWEPS